MHQFTEKEITEKENSTQDEQYETAIIQMLQLFPMQLTTEFLETASQGLKDKGNRQGEASVLCALGTIALTQNQIGKAIELLQRSLCACQAGGDSQTEAKVLLELGQAYNLKQQTYQSVAFPQAEAHLQLGATLSQIGASYAQQNDIEKAILYLQQAVEVRELIRGQLQDANLESLQDYVNSSAKDYYLLATLLQQQGKGQEALEILNLLSVIQLSQSLQQPQAELKTLEPPEIQELQEDLEPQQPSLELGVQAAQTAQEKLEQPETQSQIDKNGQIHPKQWLRIVIDQAVISKPTAPEFAQALETAGVEVEANLSTTGRINGLSYGIDTRHYYGYQLGKAYTWESLQKRGVRYSIKRDAADLERYRSKSAGRNAMDLEPVETLQPEKSSVNSTGSKVATQSKLKDLLPAPAEKPKSKAKRTPIATQKTSKSELPATPAKPNSTPTKSATITPKQYLQNLIEQAITEKLTAPQFAQRLEDAGAEVRASVTTNGQMKGFSFRLQGEHFSSSDLGRSYTWRSLLNRGLTYEPQRDLSELQKYSLSFDQRKQSRINTDSTSDSMGGNNSR